MDWVGVEARVVAGVDLCVVSDNSSTVAGEGILPRGWSFEEMPLS